MHTAASGGLGGHQGDSAQAQQFEEGGGVLVELTQLSLCPGQVHTAETQQEQQVTGSYSERFSQLAEQTEVTTTEPSP